MKNKQKQTATLAMVTVLGVTNLVNPVIPAIAKESNQMVEENKATTPSIPEPQDYQAYAESTEDVLINDTNFPDKAFQEYLKAQDYGSDGKITQSEISGISAIIVSNNKEIKSLKGIEKFTALKDLSCYSTGITALDVSQNTALENLQIYFTEISTLDVSQNKELKTLDCMYTNISSLDVSHNEKLIVLNCFGTDITSIDIRHNTALVDLRFANTGITTLDVSHNTALENLDISNTGITTLDVSHNTALKTLYISNTGITTLDVSHNTALYEFYLSNTGITTLDVSQNSALKYLYCRNTGITALDLSHNTALYEFYFSDNDITTLDVSHNIALKTLDISNTGITALDVSHNTALESLGCENTPLTFLNIGNNANLVLEGALPSETITVEVTSDTFKIQDKIAGIDTSKVTITSGADYNPATGVVSGYTIGTPIVYTYDCGTSSTGNTKLNVTIELKESIGEKSIAISPENFPDEAFRKFLKAQPYGSDDKIIQSEINNISSLNVADYTEIKSLKGIELFTALTDLNCSNTGITTLDISHNTALKMLSCGKTALVYLNIGNNENLLIKSDDLLPTSIKVTGDTFKIQDMFAGIDTHKVTITIGATYDSETGEVSAYTKETPIIYTYDCGISSQGKTTITVTLHVLKENDTIGGVELEKKPNIEHKEVGSKKEGNEILVKAGATISNGLWSMILAFGAGTLAIIKGKKHKEMED